MSFSTTPRTVYSRPVGTIFRTTSNCKGYSLKNGRVSVEGDLNCNFESPCCWKNSKPPQDTMEWVLSNGEIDSDKFSNFFHSSPPGKGSDNV